MFEDFVSVQNVLASIGCVGFWDADYSAGRIRTTGQLTALYGLTPSQGEQGASWSEIDHAFHPDDIDIIRRLRRCPATVRSGSQIVRFRMIDADGQTRRMEGHGSVLVNRDGMLARTTVWFSKRRTAALSLRRTSRSRHRSSVSIACRPTCFRSVVRQSSLASRMSKPICVPPCPRSSIYSGASFG